MKTETAVVVRFWVKFLKNLTLLSSYKSHKKNIKKLNYNTKGKWYTQQDGRKQE